MNIVGLSGLIFIIFFLHIIIRRYEILENKTKEVMTIIKNKYNIEKPVSVNEKKELMNYEKINLENVEDEKGIDLDTDFSLFKKDLLKYVDDSRDIFRTELFNDSNLVNNKKYLKENNIYQQKKEYDFNNLDIEQIIQQPFKKTNIGSMDQELQKINENINKMKNDGLEVQTLKPDMWVHKNENSMNGGKLFNDSELLAYDNGEELDYKMI